MELASVRLLPISQTGNEVGLLPYQASLDVYIVCSVCYVLSLAELV